MTGRLSISTRLALGYGGGTLLLLALFAAFVYTAFHISLRGDFDRHLEHEFHQLHPHLVVVDGEARLREDAFQSVALTTDGVFGTYVRVIDSEGEVVQESPNLARRSPGPVRLPADARPAGVHDQWDGERVRTRYTPVEGPAGQQAGWIEVTGIHSTVDRELSRLAWLLTIGVALGALLAAAFGFLMARNALRPVAALTAAANRIRSADRTARLPVPAGRADELHDLAQTFNRMLERLGEGFEQEQRFTDNAAHELLTPLATLRSEAEVTLRRSRSGDDYEAALRRILEDIDRMTRIVTQLLALARADQPQRPPEPVDAAAVVGAIAARLQRAAEREKLPFDVELSAALTRIRQTHLEEIAENLIDNAVKYASGEGRISISVRPEGSSVVLEVADAGAGFGAEEAPRLFDRFYRSDAPAIQAKPGTGLGLSLVKALAENAAGTVGATSPGEGLGSTFTVRLPRAE